MTTRCGAGDAVLTVKDAIAKHVRWKITLQLAIVRLEPLSPGAVRAIENPEECCIGAWFRSRHTVAIRHKPEYASVAAHHVAFHREMVQIADRIANKDFAAASGHLDPRGSFHHASLALATALTALDRIQKIALRD
jgi:hypothetical protein